jgi:hypothetical protein
VKERRSGSFRRSMRLSQDKDEKDQRPLRERGGREESYGSDRESVGRSGEWGGRNGRPVVLRYVLGKMGVVYKTAPMQVVDRLQQADLIADRPVAEGAVAIAAHLACGTVAGAALGALRQKREDVKTELAVGATLGILLWGVGWAGWLPILGADRAPWSYRTPNALLPVLDHAVYGAAWGLLFWALSRRKG